MDPRWQSSYQARGGESSGGFCTSHEMLSRWVTCITSVHTTHWPEQVIQSHWATQDRKFSPIVDVEEVRCENTWQNAWLPQAPQDMKGSDSAPTSPFTHPYPAYPPGGLQILQGGHADFPLILSQWPIAIIIPRVCNSAGKWIESDHSVWKWLGWDWNPGLFDSKTILLLPELGAP